jgi:hypothetical protein
MLKSIIFKTLKPNYTSQIIKPFSMYRSNGLQKEYEKEKAEYNKQKKETIRNHQKQYWEEQTKIENDYLEEFTIANKRKKMILDGKHRNGMIKNAMLCYKNIQFEIERQQKFIAKQKIWREQDAQELLDKHSLLTMLDRQAEEDWLTPSNFDEKVSKEMNKILPPTILSHVDYYNRLQKYAVLMDAGKTELAEELKINKKVIDYKNRMLQSIYEELKVVIKYLTYTEEHSVFSLYQHTILRIENYLQPNTNQDSKFLIDKFTTLFKNLIALIRLENSNPDRKVELIENQLKALTMILVLWNKYTEVIYLPEHQVEGILNKKGEDDQGQDGIKRPDTLEELLEKGDPRLLKEYHFTRITDKRSKGLKDFRGLFDDQPIKTEVEDKFVPKDKVKSILERNDLMQEGKEEYTETEDEEGKENFILQKSEQEKQDKIAGKETVSSKKPEAKKSKDKDKKKITGEKRKLLENQAEEVFQEKVPAGKPESESKSKSKTESEKTIEDPLEPKIKTYEQIKEEEERKGKGLLEKYMLESLKAQVKSKYHI